MHLFEFLTSTTLAPASVCVLSGDEPFLKQLGREHLQRLLLGEKNEEVPCSHFVGDETNLRTVIGELSTVSLFGGSGTKRVVILREADSFVTANRAALEEYVAKPKRTGVLVLEVDSWPSNTKLYKAVEQTGITIDCRPPEYARGKGKVPDEARIKQWLIDWGKSRHSIVVEPRAAQELLDLVGPVFGMLDQDLAKLALYAPNGGKVTAEMVREIIGGWRAQTSWDMIDAAADGRTAEALLQLDRILQAGEHPLAVFGSVAWSLRRYHAAVRAHEAAERQGKRPSVRDSLLAVGFKDYPQGAMQKAESNLKQLGRDRAGKFYRWLLDLDLSLKGTHSQPDRARLALEHLFFRMSAKETKSS